MFNIFLKSQIFVFLENILREVVPASRSNEALFSAFDSDSSVSFQVEKQDKSLTKLDKEKQFPAAGNKTMLISVTDHTDLGTAEPEIDVDKLDIPDPDNKYDEADKLPVTDDNDVSGKVINVSLNLRNDLKIVNDVEFRHSPGGEIDLLSGHTNILSTSSPSFWDLNNNNNIAEEKSGSDSEH